MSEFLSTILSNPNAFDESLFNDIKVHGLTRAWIVKFIQADSLNCEPTQQTEVLVVIFFHLVDELYARGCNKAEICALAKLTAQYWIESLDRSLTDNVRSLHLALEPLVPSKVSDRAAEIYLAYMVQSHLQHFQLYRACLAERRRDPRLRRGVTAEAPDAPLPLREGRRPEEHQYHCQLKELELEEQLTRGARTAQRLEDGAELMRRQRDLEDRVDAPPDADDEQYPKSLISDCLDVNLRQLRLRVQDMADNSSIDLVYKAKRTALPRPAGMGPPPRYSASSTVAGGTVAAERKSAPSSRSSAKSRGGGDGGGKKTAKAK